MTGTNPPRPPRPPTPIKPQVPAQAQPAVVPVAPAKPAQPGPSSKPVQPARQAQRPPTKPVAPSKPAAASKPAAPSKPVAPSKPAKPQVAAAQAPAAPDPLVGTTLGRCRIEARIGQGRTAVVYRAHHTALEATVAIKVLSPQAGAVPEIVEKFASEARAIARIDNENVLKIFDVGQEGQQHFLVMELLDGDSILDVLQREGRLETTDALRVARQAANGLAAAHTAGIIHRDVKPQNLVLLQDGTVKVVDFGLAADDDTGSQRVGTPHYMAPEVCESGQAVPQSDVYGLGISLFHMLTGQPPYVGKQVKEILQAHVKCEPLYPERKVAGLPREVAELVRRLTKRDPLVRPTAAELVADLDRIGGQDLRKKDALKARSARFRGHVRAQKGAPTVPLIVGGVVVVGGLIAALSMGGSGSSDRPSAPPSPAGASAPSAPPTQPGVKPESPQEKEARLKREAEAQTRRREAEAGTALKAREGWAREAWHGPADTETVLAAYRRFKDEWKGTEAAKVVDERIRQIVAGKVHPHPDLSWSDADAVEAVRKRWVEALPQVEAHLAKGEYALARPLVPMPVEDMGGQLALELRFWGDLTEHLEEFQSALVANWKDIPSDQRTLQLPDGKVELRGVLAGGFFDVLHDGKSVRLTWADVPAAEIYRVAHASASGKGAERLLGCMAFAWSARLSEEFWGAKLDLGTAPDAAKVQREAAAYERTWEARSAGK